MTGLRCGDMVLANGGLSVVLSCWSCRHLICEYCSRRKIRGVGWPALDRVVDEPASVGCTDLEWVGAQAKEKKSPRLTPSEVRFSYQKEKDSVGDGRWDFFFLNGWPELTAAWTTRSNLLSG